jgi:hypothetical protein
MGSLDKSTENALAQRDTILNMIVKAAQAKSLDESRAASAQERAARTDSIKQATADRLLQRYGGTDITDYPDVQAQFEQAGLGPFLERKAGTPAQAAPVSLPGATLGQPPSAGGVHLPGTQGDMALPSAAMSKPGVQIPGTLIDGIQQAKQTSGTTPTVSVRATPAQQKEQQRIHDISAFLDETDENKKAQLAMGLQLKYNIKTLPMQDGTSHLYQVTAQGVQDLGVIPGLKAPKIIQQSQSAQLGGDINPAAAKILAENFLKTGKQPSMGRGGWGSPLGMQVSNAMMDVVNEGLASPDVATNEAARKAASMVYGTLAKNYSQVGTSATIATKNLDLVLQAQPDVRNTDSSWINQHMQDFLRGATSSPGLSDYEVKIYTAAREYAKVMTGSSASVAELSAAAVQQVSQILNSAKSPEALAAAVNAMKQDMANITGTNAATLLKWQDAIKTAGTGGTGFGSQTGSVPGVLPTPQTPAAKPGAASTPAPRVAAKPGETRYFRDPSGNVVPKRWDGQRWVVVGATNGQ